MTEFRLRIEKLEMGRVRGTIWDVDSGSLNGTETQIWQLEVNLDTTRYAQKVVFKAAADYLNSFVDLSHGGLE